MDIKVHKTDLPEDLNVGNRVAVDCEFMGLNFQRDKLCLVQISSGNSDAHIVQLDRNEYKAPILKKILSDKSIKKIFHFARADLTFIKKYLLRINALFLNLSVLRNLFRLVSSLLGSRYKYLTERAHRQEVFRPI